MRPAAASPLFLCPLLLVPLAAQPPQKHLLRLKFTPGTKLHFVVTQHERTTGVREPEELTYQLEQSIDLEIEPAAPNGGLIPLRQRILRIRSKQFDRTLPNHTGHDHDYDSDRDDSVPVSAMQVAGMLGKTVLTTVDTRGRVNGAAGGKRGPRGPDAAAGGPLAMPFDEFFLDLPERAVAVGETWTGDWTLPGLMNRRLPLRITSRLEKVEHGRAHVTQSMQTDPAFVPDGLDRIIAPHRSLGALTLDLATGRIVDLRLQITMCSMDDEGLPDLDGMVDELVQTIRAVAPPSKSERDARQRPKKQS